MLAEALEHLVRGVVDNPDDVTVRDKQLRRGSLLEVRVHPDDLGKVIGRGGRTASAFRTVISANDTSRVDRCHRARATVSVERPNADPPGGSARSAAPSANRRSGSSVRTSTVTSPRMPWGLPIRPTTTSRVSAT